MWVIWSEEHGGWWAVPSGYTTCLERAARYPEARAVEIEAQANRYLPAGTYHEIAMPEIRVARPVGGRLRTGLRRSGG